MLRPLKNRKLAAGTGTGVIDVICALSWKLGERSVGSIIPSPKVRPPKSVASNDSGSARLEMVCPVLSFPLIDILTS